jgi:hypothetical protein
LIRSYNLPVGAHLMVENGEKIKAGKVLVKIPRRSSKSEILQEVYQELLKTCCSFKEIDGNCCSFGKLKEVTVRLS